MASFALDFCKVILCYILIKISLFGKKITTHEWIASWKADEINYSLSLKHLVALEPGTCNYYCLLGKIMYLYGWFTQMWLV